MPKIIRFHKTGGADVLKVEDLPLADGTLPGPPLKLVRTILVGLLILSLVAYSGHVLMVEVPLDDFDFSVAEMYLFIQTWGRWAMIASILLMILHSFVPIPAELLAVANGMLFGPLWGMAVTWIGAMFGAYLAFGVSRALGRSFVLRMVPRKHRDRLDAWAQRQGSAALLLGRLIPIVSFNAINYAAGLTNISWWTFSWTTGLGILPLTALMVVIGDQVLTWPWTVWVAAGSVAVVVSLLGWRLVRRLAR